MFALVADLIFYWARILFFSHSPKSNPSTNNHQIHGLNSMMLCLSLLEDNLFGNYAEVPPEFVPKIGPQVVLHMVPEIDVKVARPKVVRTVVLKWRDPPKWPQMLF